MFYDNPNPDELQPLALEEKLKQQADSRQRLLLLDKLLSRYAYTNVKRAEELLEELGGILEGESNKDILVNYHLLASTVANQLNKYEEAQEHILQAIKLVEERGTAREQIDAYIDFVGVCINLRDMGRAIDYIQKAEALLKSFPDSRLESRLMCREGFVRLYSRDHSGAVEALLRADQLLNSFGELALKDYYFLSLIQAGLGRVYELSGEREKSAAAYGRVVAICENKALHARLSWHYVNAGNGYMSLNDQETAEAYFRRAIEISDDSSEIARAFAYSNLGYCAMEKGDYDDALSLFDRAEQTYRQREEDMAENQMKIDLWRSQIYTELKQYAKAEEALRIALQHAQAEQNPEYLATVHKSTAAYFADRGDFEKAYSHFAHYDRYREEQIANSDQDRQREIEAKYEAEKKRQEAEMLQLQATGLQLKALNAQMNPHFMYNALNSIQNYITSHDVNLATKYLAKFAQLMRQSLEYSNQEVISLEEEIQFLEQYLYINEKLRFNDRLDHEIIIDEEIEEDILGVPTMIIQPYVENAIEHGLSTRSDGMIKILFLLYDEETILCRVEDNGIGFNKARQLKLNDPRYQNHRSRGTSITEERLRILRKARGHEQSVRTIDLAEESGGKEQGTRVEILIPIREINLGKIS